MKLMQLGYQAAADDYGVQCMLANTNNDQAKEAELISTYGPDSDLGRTAAVMLGSTETTFYTIAVYFGAVGITKTRYAVPAALCADLTGFLAAAWAVRICFGSGI